MNNHNATQNLIAQNNANDRELSSELQILYGKSLSDVERDVDSELAKGIDGLSKVTDSQKRIYKNKHDEVFNAAQEVLSNNPDLSYTDFKKQVESRLKAYTATSEINQSEFLKSLAGLGVISLGLKVLQLANKRLYQDVNISLDAVGREIGKDVKLSSKKIRDLVLKGIDGANFSERIWRDTDVVKAQLDEIIPKMLVSGKSNQEMAAELKKRVEIIANNQRYVTERIVRTESARAETEAAKQVIKAQGFKYVKWIDEAGACKACVNIAEGGNLKDEYGVYTLDDVPYLPVHPNCRCAITPYEKQ